jgi:hypothetical protein
MTQKTLPTKLQLFMRICEMAGGAQPWPARLGGRWSSALVQGLWWVTLFLMALAFAGRNSKFIYIDF